jgi:hypothetical protein
MVEGVAWPIFDLAPAAQYGETEVLMPFAQSMLATVPTVRALKEKLRNFTDDDYLLPVGDPVLISTVAMIAAEQNGGRVKFLKWDKPTHSYVVIPVDTSGKAL